MVKQNLDENNAKLSKKITKEEILGSEKIKRFLNSQRTGGTRGKYDYFVEKYFKFINENPDNYLVDDYEFLEVNEKKKYHRKYRNDLHDFKAELNNELNKYGRENKPSSNRTTLSCLHSLFTFNEIDLSINFWKQLNNYKNTRASKIAPLDHDKLKQILDHTDIQGKCIFLIQATSGSRISSVLELKFEDIDLDHEFPRITFYYKSVKNRITKTKRVSPECKRFLQSYFKLHNFKEGDYIFLSPRDPNKHMTRQNANYKWDCALKKAKLYEKDKNTGRATITTQRLKAFFKTNFKQSDDNKLRDYFAEHGDLDERYINMTEKQLDELYSKSVGELLIYERSYDTDTRVKELQKENTELKGQVKVLTVKTKSYDNNLEDIETRLDKTESILKRRMQDNLHAGPFYGIDLTPEEREYEEKLENEEISKREQQMKNQLYTNPKLKNYELFHLDGGVPVFKKKRKEKPSMNEILEALADNFFRNAINQLGEKERNQYLESLKRPRNTKSNTELRKQFKKDKSSTNKEDNY
jgi:integrase